MSDSERPKRILTGDRPTGRLHLGHWVGSIAEQSLPFGLLGYPILQAADILLARAHLVPVGRDNLAHVEITRELARQFNSTYGPAFVEPEPLLSDIPEFVGTDNRGKMSKSAGNAIFLCDDEQTVTAKVSGNDAGGQSKDGNRPCLGITACP